MMVYSLSCLGYLPFLISALLSIHQARGADTTTANVAKCPRPTQPVFITKFNERDAFTDDSTYTDKSESLPMKCISEDFVLKDPVSAKCVDGKWKIPDYECVPQIYIERRVTDKIMIISGVVFGVMAALFVIVKIVFYLKQHNKEKKLQGADVRGEVELKERRRSPSLVLRDPTNMDRISRHSYPPHERAFNNAANDPTSVYDSGLNPPRSRPSQHYDRHRRGSPSMDSQYYSHDSMEASHPGPQHTTDVTHPRDSY